MSNITPKNGCNHRTYVYEFYKVKIGETEKEEDAEPIQFWIIGGDQGLAYKPKLATRLTHMPGARFQIVFDFKDFKDERILMYNLGADTFFEGNVTEFILNKNAYSRTDRITAFDVELKKDKDIKDEFDPKLIHEEPDVPEPTRVRKVGLYSGKKSDGGFLFLGGTAEPATDYLGNPIYYPDTEVYQEAGLAGMYSVVVCIYLLLRDSWEPDANTLIIFAGKQMNGAMAWHEKTTENPALGSSEVRARIWCYVVMC